MAKAKKVVKNENENELMLALELIQKEKNISKDTLLDAIENSLLQACKSHFGRTDNIRVEIDRNTCKYRVLAEKEVVEEVEDPTCQISLEDARKINVQYYLGDMALVNIESRDFGRISAGIAKNVILQKIREEERKSLFNYYIEKKSEIITGTVQRTGNTNGNINVNIGRCDAILPENEQVKGEELEPTQKVKVYILDVKETSKGPRIQVSRTHPGLVKRLFEMQVTEVSDGTVEIKEIAREAGSRTKMAVYSNDENVDAVGACVGVNGERVNAVVKELNGEKIDIIEWNENPALLIENALNPAQVICVIADEELKEAQVIVPDSQLSLAIGKVGQNARLAAKLTSYKIDIKSETEARNSGLFDELVPDDSEEEVIGYSENEEKEASEE